MAKEEEERSQEVVSDVRIHVKNRISLDLLLFLISLITYQKKIKWKMFYKIITKITIKTNKYS
jgi:hypothetical protein